MSTTLTGAPVSTVDGTEDASATTPTGVRRVLQRQILPADRDMDVLPLYIDREQAILDAGGDRGKDGTTVVMAQTEHLEPEAVLDRHRLRVRPGKRVSFGTYFNGFPASYWRMWTIVKSVTLTVRVTGAEATIVVYRSMADGRSQRVDAVTTEEAEGGEYTFELPLKPFGDGGWYWYDVLTGSEDVIVESAEWSAVVPEDRAEQGTVTIGITTMNRPEFCSQLLAQVGSDPLVHDLLDEVLVIEQGTQLVKDAEDFPAAQEALGDKLRIIEQGNIGGSGGFARAQLEALEADRSTYVLFLDDDIVAEPESIMRAATFADLARRQTIVGGHMFSLYAKSRLHSFGEIINRYRFWWESPGTVRNDWDFSERNLRSSRWLHRRIDVDFNGWFMCLIPLDVVRDIGLSLPLFIKWDDAEYGVRAAEAGYPTVTMPGAAVWHVPWTDKNDGLDWQSYFHHHNRIIAALLHSPYERGGRMVRESFNHQVKHLASLQYSTAELRHLAMEDVLRGPHALHGELSTKLADINAFRKQWPDAQLHADRDDLPPVHRKKPPKKGKSDIEIPGRKSTLVAAALAPLRQLRPVREMATDYPETELTAMDAKWWNLVKYDSAVVSMNDGTSVALYQRDPAHYRDLLKRTVDIHRRFHREWPQLAQQYRDALGEITSPEAWEKTFAPWMQDETRDDTSDGDA